MSKPFTTKSVRFTGVTSQSMLMNTSPDLAGEIVIIQLVVPPPRTLAAMQSSDVDAIIFFTTSLRVAWSPAIPSRGEPDADAKLWGWIVVF